MYYIEFEAARHPHAGIGLWKLSLMASQWIYLFQEYTVQPTDLNMHSAFSLVALFTSGKTYSGRGKESLFKVQIFL